MDDISPADDRPDPYKKQRERARAESAELDRTDTMLLTRPASDWHLPVRDRKAYSEELFGPLWRVGEVALLFGPRGVGKSVLAVQIAESIARGRPVPPIPKSKSRRRGEKVLYVDMQRSEAQWTERYTFASPVPGRLRRRYRFSKNFDRAGIDWTNVDLEAYNRDPVKYALRSIFHNIEDSRAKVVIIDDIQLGGANALGRKGILRTMQTLKMWAATEGLSILVLASAGSPRVSSPHVSKGSSSPHSALRIPHSAFLSLADTVFALAPSTFGPQYRYIKPLRSPVHPSSFDIHHSHDVLTFQLNSEGPFLALRFLGPSNESDHLRDYAAEARDCLVSDSERKKQLRKAARESAVDMLMSKEYWRYLDE